jgi:hypothetical protein
MPVQWFEMSKGKSLENFIALFFLMSASALGCHASYLNSSDSVIDWSELSGFGTMPSENISSSLSKTSSGFVLVTQSPADGIVYNERVDDLWNGWKKLDGRMKGMAAIDSEGNDLFLAIRGLNDAVWFNERLSGIWSGWSNWSGQTLASPAIVKSSGGLVVSVKGLDSKLWVKRRNNNGSYVDWTQIGTLQINGDICMSEENNTLIVAARDASGSVYVIERNPANVWGSWTSIGGTVVADPFVYLKDGVVYVSAVGTDNALWYNKRENSIWQGWQSLGGGLLGRPVVAGINGRVIFSAMAPGQTIFYRVLEDGLWSEWTAAVGTSKYFNLAGGENEYLLSTLGTNNQVYRRSYYPTKTYTSEDYPFADYSIEDTSSGGKRLIFYLSNSNQEVKLSYAVEPGRKALYKTLGLAVSDRVIPWTNHINNPVSGVYVIVNGSQFRIGNSYIERNFIISGGVLRTTEVYNKISSVRHMIDSDEFGIKYRNSTRPFYIDLERISFNENAVWSWGAGDPLVYSDLFFWETNPVSIPKLISQGGRQYAIQRIYTYSDLSDQYLFNGSEAILGATRYGKGLEEFKAYLLDQKKPENKFFYNYNTWWTLPFQYSERNVTDLIDVLSANLLEPYGVDLDSFTLDEGWAEPHSIWKINNATLPNGFDAINSKLRSKNSSLGLWISPSAIYSTLDKDWAAQNGYYVYNYTYSNWPGKWLCHFEAPGKKSYSEEFKNTLSGYISQYNLTTIKFDALLSCHDYDSEEYQNFFNLWDYLISIKADVKYELNIIYNPTALPRGDGVKDFSSDYPSGVLPALNNKEAYLTTRDHFWIYSATRNMPSRFVDPYGIIIQTDEDWRNDAVVNLLRGTSLISLYVNPKNMREADWSDLASLLNWGKEQEEKLLVNTYIIGGEPQDGDVYGISHYYEPSRDAYIMLRNPAINEKSYSLILNETAGFTVDDSYIIKIVYPYAYAFDSVYLKGSTQNITLKGFETLVIHVMPYSSVKNEVLGARYEILGDNSLRLWSRENGRAGARLMLNGSDPSYERISIENCDVPASLKVHPTGVSHSRDSISGSFSIESTPSYNATLIVLINSTQRFDVDSLNSYSFIVDSSTVIPQIKKSSGQWIAEDGDYRHYWVYYIVPLPAGNHSVSFSVSNLPDGVSSSSDIIYSESLTGTDYAVSGWINDPDESLLIYSQDKTNGTISLDASYEYPKCGDGICSCNEDENICPADCASIVTTTTMTTTTTLPDRCSMPGNYPEVDGSCDEVTLSEIVNAINMWAVDTFQLADVVNLINSWADPVRFPPQ